MELQLCKEIGGEQKKKSQPSQFESVQNRIIIYGTPTVLLQPGVRIQSARTLSSLSCCNIPIHASAPQCLEFAT